MELRLGDARKVLSDIRDNSVSLILTDPRRSDAAEPLYQWTPTLLRVCSFQGRWLCFVGEARLDRWVAILSGKLRFGSRCRLNWITLSGSWENS
jgi:hypothetical protein